MKTRTYLCVVYVLLALPAVALVGMPVGCGPAEDTEVHPVWPPPPAAARIVHVKNLRRAADLAKPSFLQRLSATLTGSQDISLVRPHGVAVQEGKYIYVTDQERQAVFVFGLDSSKVTVLAGVGEMPFVSPVGVAACGEYFAVSDSVQKSVFILTPEGKYVRALAKPGGFKRPTGLAWDAKNGHLYVVDTLACDVSVFELASGRLVRTFGAPGRNPGHFNHPTHICLDRNGRIYVADSLNFRVQVFRSDGRYLFEIGKQGDASGHLAIPKGIGVDGEGHLYIVDSYFSTVQVFDERGNFLLAIGQPGPGPGEFEVPAGLTIDSHNRIYVCDSQNSRVQVLQFVGGPDDGEEEQPATQSQPEP